MNENKSYENIKKRLGKPFQKIMNIKVEGQDNIPKEGAVLLVGNHRSLLDACICIVGSNRIIHFLAKDKFYDKLVFRKLFPKLGCIRVDTLSGDINRSAIDSGIEVLKNDGVLGIFPEGGRNKTKANLIKFKKGAAMMAIETNVKLVPFAITGKYRIRSKDLTITFGKPFKVSNITRKEATEKIRNEVEQIIISKKDNK